MMSEDDDREPVSASPARRDLWCDAIYDAVVATPQSLRINGGSDRGEFAYLGPVNDVRCISGKVEEGDTLLEIEGHRVAGYTRNDIVSLLGQSGQQCGRPVTVKAVRAGHLVQDLRQYLNTRFQKGSIDHDLQSTIRDNLYLRTVPCTTRSPKEGEVDGVDYTFLTAEEFAALERAGSLLESGIYEGNHYGTPKPVDAVPTGGPPLLPGAHPSSEGKRRRNRSNVEAMTAKTETHAGGTIVPNGTRCPTVDSYVARETSETEPLPSYWEKPYAEEPYFTEPNTLQRQDQHGGTYGSELDLPHGWERIDDPHYGTYYIDHVNRKTQYESPMVSDRRATEQGTPRPCLGTEASDQRQEQQQQRLEPRGGGYPSSLSPTNPCAGGAPYRFTRNPSELQGSIVHASLVKGPRGFGFTIVGADEDGSEEFLQIKSIVPNGPAWNDGKLQTGDVLVYVNGSCVLGYTHQGVVNLFQSIAPGEMVHLQVCRGYPLPFDLDDPNTEIVTTMAVTSLQDHPPNDYQDIYSGKQLQEDSPPEESKARPTKSLPDLSCHDSSHTEGQPQRHSSALYLGSPQEPQGELITTEIVKGTSGFGFTIADSAHGQKVKKILDEPRCGVLQEGDILVEINGCSVRGRLHSHVVQMLKDCPVGRSAALTLHRGAVQNKNKLRPAKIPSDLLLSSQSPHPAPLKSSQSASMVRPAGVSPYQGPYRSKTPTADLYSSRDKEPINVGRPKTPLVDTRHWGDQPQLPLVDPNPPVPSGPAKPPRAGHYGAWHPGEQLLDLPSSEWREAVPGSRLPWPRNSPSYYANGGIYDHHKAPSINTSQSPLGLPSEEWCQPGADWASEGNMLPTSSWNYEYGSGSPRSSGRLPSLTYPPASAPANSGYCPLYSSPPLREQHSMSPYLQDGGTVGSKQWTSFEREQPAPCPSQQQHSNQEEYIDLTVTIHRQESGFGFRIVGGTEEGSQVSIGHIVPGGAADLDRRLMTGDEILSVDNQAVLNASHHHVVQLMGNAALRGRVTLGLRRKMHRTMDSPSRPNNCEVSYPYNVTVVRQENEGFGFVIISSVGKAGSTIGRIIEDSPAERCGQLHVGDRILAVNGVSILDMHHGEIVNLIKMSGFSVVLTIGAPVDDNSSTASISQRGEEVPPGAAEEEYHSVELQRGVRGFGFSIRGGREFHNMPLFVLRIADQGPAQQSGKLQVGDQILEVNGTSTRNMTHADAIEIIRQGGNTVRLLVKRNCNKGSKGSPLVHVEGLPVMLQPPLPSGLCSGPLSQSSPRGYGTSHRDWYNWNIET